MYTPGVRSAYLRAQLLHTPPLLLLYLSPHLPSKCLQGCSTLRPSHTLRFVCELTLLSNQVGYSASSATYVSSFYPYDTTSHRLTWLEIFLLLQHRAHSRYPLSRWFLQSRRVRRLYYRWYVETLPPSLSRATWLAYCCREWAEDSLLTFLGRERLLPFTLPEVSLSRTPPKNFRVFKDLSTDRELGLFPGDPLLGYPEESVSGGSSTRVLATVFCVLWFFLFLTTLPLLYQNKWASSAEWRLRLVRPDLTSVEYPDFEALDTVALDVTTPSTPVRGGHGCTNPTYLYSLGHGLCLSCQMGELLWSIPLRSTSSQRLALSGLPQAHWSPYFMSREEKKEYLLLDEPDLIFFDWWPGWLSYSLHFVYPTKPKQLWPMYQDIDLLCLGGEFYSFLRGCRQGWMFFTHATL